MTRQELGRDEHAIEACAKALQTVSTLQKQLSPLILMMIIATSNSAFR